MIAAETAAFVWQRRKAFLKRIPERGAIAMIAGGVIVPFLTGFIQAWEMDLLQGTLTAALLDCLAGTGTDRDLVVTAHVEVVIRHGHDGMAATDDTVDQAKFLALVRALEELMRAMDNGKRILPKDIGARPETLMRAARQCGM